MRKLTRKDSEKLVEGLEKSILGDLSQEVDSDEDGARDLLDCQPLDPAKRDSSFRDVQDRYLKGTPLLRVRGIDEAHYAWSVLWSPSYLKGVSWKRASREYDGLKRALSELGIDVSGTEAELRRRWKGVR